MSREIIVFGDLYLSCDDIQEKDGILTAYVRNGHWHLRYANGVAQALDGKGNVHAEWNASPRLRLPIPDHINGYNTAIEWAKQQP